MKTRHLLYISQLNRETFNALKRRGHLPFLDKHVGEGVDRYDRWHALGMAAFAYFRQIPIETQAAGEAINDSWADIIRIAGLVAEPPRSELCGPRINDIGLRDSFGWHHPASKGGEPVAFAAVNLRVLWEWIQPLIAEIEGQPPADQEGDD